MPSMDTDYTTANCTKVSIEYEEWDGQAVKNCLDNFFVKTKAADLSEHFVCTERTERTGTPYRDERKDNQS